MPRIVTGTTGFQLQVVVVGAVPALPFLYLEDGIPLADDAPQHGRNVHAHLPLRLDAEASRLRVLAADPDVARPDTGELGLVERRIAERRVHGIEVLRIAMRSLYFHGRDLS